MIFLASHCCCTRSHALLHAPDRLQKMGLLFATVRAIQQVVDDVDTREADG